MAWIRAELRGKSVLARADERGALSTDGGRVEIRYRANDGKLYRAAASNLVVVDATPLPDDTCGPASAPEPERKPGTGSSRGRGSRPGSGKKPKAALAAEHAARPAPAVDVVAYTDGACSGNPGPAGLGVVLDRSGARLELSEYLGVGTNNIAELTAILRALEALDGGATAVVNTDSQYAIGVLQRGWKAKANQQLVATIRAELARRGNVSLAYVPGHAGVPQNERADELARRAIAARRSERWREVGGGG